MKLSVIESRANFREDVFKGTEISWEIIGDGIRVDIPTDYTCYRIISCISSLCPFLFLFQWLLAKDCEWLPTLLQ